MKFLAVKIPKIKASKRVIVDEDVANNLKNKKLHSRKIWEILQNILPKVRDNIETNYLAVIYECLSNLCNILSDIDIKNNRFEYFIKLNSRIGKYGLYYFKGMKEARLDITGHIIFQPN